MASEAKSREEIQRFRALLEEMRAAEASPQESSSTVLLVVKAARGKDDLFFPTNVDCDDWLKHFELVCANINQWSSKPRRQQLAV